MGSVGRLPHYSVERGKRKEISLYTEGYLLHAHGNYEARQHVGLFEKRFQSERANLREDGDGFLSVIIGNLYCNHVDSLGMNYSISQL